MTTPRRRRRPCCSHIAERHKTRSRLKKKKKNESCSRRSHLSPLSSAAGAVLFTAGAAATSSTSFSCAWGEALLGVLSPWMVENIATSPANAIENMRTPATPADTFQFRRKMLFALLDTGPPSLFLLRDLSRPSPSSARPDPSRPALPHPRIGSAAAPSNGEPSVVLPGINHPAHTDTHPASERVQTLSKRVALSAAC